MRVADVQLTFPAILTALLIDGVALAMFKDYRLEAANSGSWSSRSASPSGCSMRARCAA